MPQELLQLQLVFLVGLEDLEHLGLEFALDIVQSVALLGKVGDLSREHIVAVLTQSDLLVQPIVAQLEFFILSGRLDARDEQAQEWRQLFVREKQSLSARLR